MVTGGGKSGEKSTASSVAQKFEATPVTILPGTAILLFINCVYIFYKFDVYDLYNRDEPDLIYKIAGNTLGKVRSGEERRAEVTRIQDVSNAINTIARRRSVPLISGSSSFPWLRSPPYCKR